MGRRRQVLYGLACVISYGHTQIEYELAGSGRDECAAVVEAFGAEVIVA